ncbi:MAG: beta-lactamase/prolyl oligopeptidase [Microbacterium sp.]|jgi:dipeptidyl aminopeptidase/acylaminoacyl peptidase/CubicO group peptidase (beta-lactamase class C family)|uniref:serine hydrolase n=1 Tax=Microbacterium sp. TaxID=51671 RepID=UPI0026285416|nr:serine hydrolase [Microbacterium sp.]MDF2559815.1 beta-lactamase/prolyl oligopeptidase [Microbacterium sp.]
MNRVTVDDLLAVRTPEQPALSPDGARIAFVLRTTDRDGDRDTRALWQVPTGGGAPVPLTHATADSSPVWSPDGSQLAFLRAQDGPAQIWLLPAGGGEARGLTTLPLGAGTPTWSPDGARIAFTAPVDSAALPGEKAETILARRSAPASTDRLGYKADGAGNLGTLVQQLHVVDIDSGKVTALTHGRFHASDPFWSPDGTRIAYSASVEDDADLTMRVPVFVRSATDPNRDAVQVSAADVQATAVGWTPDGRHIVAAGRTDTEVGNADLLLFPVDGGEPQSITGSLDRNVMPGGPGYPGGMPQFAENGEIVFCLRDNGYTHVYRVAQDGSGAAALVDGTANVSGLSVAASSAAIVLGTPESFGDVALLDLTDGTTRVLTDYGTPDLELVIAEERRFTISDGTVVTGWLRRDPEATGPQPLLLDIHGGPHNSSNGAADLTHPYHQVLARRGWTILTLNPRGSDGYGDAFFSAVSGGWGVNDAKDFLEPLDQLVAEGIADPARLAVTGYSYGGYMTCFLTSRDDRFAAAVAGGVVTDLLSMGGTSDFGHYLSAKENGGLPWRDAERIAPQSPYTQVDRVTTPTLILHGAADDRCPVGQAEQWFSALRERGVPTRLVLYPGASHLFPLSGTPSHRADFSRRVIDWVEQYAPPAGKPVRARLDARHWQQRLSALAEAHKVPGATLGILRLGEEPVYAHHGILNVRTGIETTDDSVFQIGSMGKVWTASVIMRLVDDGKLDLDAPIVDYVPEFASSDPEVTRTVTMRHLLSHTSGIDGDVFTDTGRGDDTLEKYVALLDGVAQNHPLGATMSYCNSGFVLAGRVIEKITGTTWDQAMRDLLFTPLGLTHSSTLPEEAIMFRAASGHTVVGDDGPELAPAWMLPRSMGPAGLINSTTADILAFARMHLTGGLAADGTRVLSEASVTRMQQHEVDVPDPYSLGDSWGIGWILFDWDGRKLIGHDGNTIGQSSFLRILLDEGVAVTLLSNGGNTRDLYDALFGEIYAELADLAIPAGLVPPEEPFSDDFSEFEGVYDRSGVRTEIFRDEDGLRMRTTLNGPLAAMLPDPVQEHPLVPVRRGEFVMRPEGEQAWHPVVFYSLPSGERYLHHGVRAAPKVS